MSVPAASPAGPGLAIASGRRLAGFAGLLRANGFAVGLAETRDALVILASAAGARAATLRPALRALFSATRSDWQRFDALFDAWWLGLGVRRTRPLRGTAPVGARPRRPASGPILPDGFRSGDAPEASHSGTDAAEGTALSRDAASSTETLAAKDLRAIAEPEEAAKVHALAARLARRMRTRLTRRRQARRSGERLDLRRTIHRSVGHGGTPVELIWRRRKVRPLRLVLMLDASGSMEPYTAFFVRFIHAVIDTFREAEAFIFHTRLVPVSAALRERNVDRALDRLALLAEGMGGGTRIGESLASFNRWHAARVINARTAVIIVSDGYDTGPPEALAREMARLAGRCRRIVWLNPLIGWRDYAPTARGMQAALPHIDLFAPAHNLESLAALEPYLARI